jgi:hypothetical protein
MLYGVGLCEKMLDPGEIEWDAVAKAALGVCVPLEPEFGFCGFEVFSYGAELVWVGGE